MAQYRFITKKVRYWRGEAHRWSNSYEFVGSGTVPDVTACETLLTQESKLLYPGLTNVGGIYESVVYASGGGVPIATYTAFDWTNPSAWVQPTGTTWTSHTPTLQTPPETALVIEWAGGLSKSGKPVNFRKWYHMVPTSTTGGTAGADIAPAQVTALGAQATTLAACLSPTYGLLLGNTRTVAGVATASGFYGNHQMPRGRRRKALVSASGKYQGPTIGGNPLITYGEEN